MFNVNYVIVISTKLRCPTNQSYKPTSFNILVKEN